MKKNFFTAALLLMCGFLGMHAQETEFQIVQGPEYIQSAADNAMFITGVSENGKYCWGNNMNDAYYYDTETGEYAVFKITPEQKQAGYKDTKIAGITNDGIAIVCLGLRECYALNIETGEKTVIESPMEDFPYLHVWDMTEDGSILAGNCINSVNKQRPMVAVRQADGTYVVTPLEYDSNDAMGAPAQFTQVRVVTNNGRHLAGPQVSETGFVSRYVTWSLNENGEYVYSSPFDDMLYDKTQEQPGVQPVFADYVTATDKTSDEYKQQKAEYDQAYSDWRKKFVAYTKNYTTVDWGAISKSIRGEYICGTLKTPLGRKKSKYSPLYYNFETEEITVLDTISDNQKGKDILPGNRYITLTGPTDVWFKIMITEDGKMKPFHEWIYEKSGTDIHDFYFTSFLDKFTWTTYEDVFMGMPCFSGDGKTLVMTTWVGSEYVTSIMKFSNSIFGDVETSIEAELVDEFSMSGSDINVGRAYVEVYTFDGCRVKSMHVEGHTDMADVLNPGNYIVKVMYGENKTKSFKLILD